tara:strand:- start:409 stop:681 length:273 start_codon:yes stop_codon:yes gene_type:complete
MKKRKGKFNRKNNNSLNNLSLFSRNENRSSKKCPLSVKNAPKIDYKNLTLLKKYVSETGKIVSSRITSISQNKQRRLNREIKRAKTLGLI